MGKDSILFSIIIPYYNSVDLLKRLLSTIPGDNDLEVIIVNDKSTKNLEAFDQLKDGNSFDNRLFLDNTGSGKGAGAARNIGLGSAHGDWLIFADSDDFFLDGAFEELRKHIESEADIIYFIPTSVDSETGESSDRNTKALKLINSYIEGPIEINDRKLRYLHTAPWSKMIRHSVILDNGVVFEETGAFNDVMFSVMAAWYADRIECITTPIYCVTKSDGSLTYTRNRKNEITKALVYCRREAFLRKRYTTGQLDEIGMKGNWRILRAIRMYHDPFLALLILLLFSMARVPVDLKKGPIRVRVRRRENQYRKKGETYPCRH